MSVRKRPNNLSEALRIREILPARILDLLEFNSATDNVCLTGSLADGFGNPTSDIDLYVASEDLSLQTGPVHGGGFWIDVTRFSKSEIHYWIEKCRTAAEYPSRWGQNLLRYSEMDTLHRLSVSIPFSPAKSGLVPHELPVGQALALSHIYSARNLWVDLIGAVQAGQTRQSAVFLGMLSERLLDAIAALSGETNPNQKWRLAKIVRLDCAKTDLNKLMFGQFSEDQNAENILASTRFVESEILRLMSELSGVSLPVDLPELPLGKLYEIHGDLLVINDTNGELVDARR